MEKWKLLLAGIRNALTDLVKKTFNVTGSVEVSNLPEVQHVVIDNHQEPSETVQVSNLVDYKEDLNKIIGELIKVPKDIKTADYSPIIKALQDVVKTLEAGKTDYSPIILAVESAVKALKLEYPEADYSSIINVIKGIQQFNLEPYLEEGELPVIINEKQIKKLVDAFGKKTGQVVAASMGGGGLSVADSTTLAGLATETTLAKLPGLSIPIHDYISRAWVAGTFTETWTFKSGGSGGTTVATITIVYDDVDKSNIVTVTKI